MAKGVLNFIGYLCLLLTALVFDANVSATDHSVSIGTSGDVNISVNGANSAIGSSTIDVATTCKAGYNLTLSTSIEDNNLYLNGDSANNMSGSYLSPSNGITPLRLAAATWGYSLDIPSNTTPPAFSAPTINNIFQPVPASNATPAVLKASASTASEEEINDEFSVYYGVNVKGVSSGTYEMAADPSGPITKGGLYYYLTANPTCITGCFTQQKL